MRHGQIADAPTHRQTDKEAKRQTDKETHRQTDTLARHAEPASENCDRMAGKSGSIAGNHDELAGKHGDDVGGKPSQSVAGNYDDLSRKYESWKEKYNKIMAGEYDVLAGDPSYGASLSVASAGTEPQSEVCQCMYVCMYDCMSVDMCRNGDTG